MALWRENIYKSHDNEFSLTVKEDGVVINLNSTGVTRMQLRLFKLSSTNNSGGYTFDSDILGEGAGNAFDWATNGDSGIVDIKIGDQDIPAGDYRAYLIIYDPFHPNGQPWPEFNARVIDVIP